MDVFTPEELAYLQETHGLARIATVSADGTPHVTPVGWTLTADGRAIEIGGNNLAATKKFRDVQRTGTAAVVIDEVLPPWRPRGIEVRGPAEAVLEPEPRIRVRPARVVSWGFEGASGGRDTGLTVAHRATTSPGQGAGARPYAVVRRNRFRQPPGPAGDRAVAATAANLEEFQRVHAAQPGFHGSVVIDAGDGIQLAITVWESEKHAADARAALGPAVERLLSPAMAGPSELIAAGEITSTDLPSLRHWLGPSAARPPLGDG